MERSRIVPLLLLLLLGMAQGQRGDVSFELGFAGRPVEGAWNPLRIVVRDQPELLVEIRVDQGNARTGPVPYTYRATVPASRGVAVFEDDFFLPAWYSLSWSVRDVNGTLASGSFDPRQRDPRPLALLSSTQAGIWLPHLASELRPQEVPAATLPRRAAPYSGVRLLIVDGTSAAPTLDSVVAAAAAGVTVILREPLPDSHAHLRPLSSAGDERYGAGRIVTVQGPDDLAGFDWTNELTDAARLVLERGVDDVRPGMFTRLAVAAVAGGYVVAVLLLLRFGGAGIVAGAALAVVAALAAWSILRPSQSLLEERATVSISAGGLALSQANVTVLSLPGGPTGLSGRLRATTPVPYAIAGDETVIELARWGGQVLIGRPLVAAADFAWDGERLLNRGSRPLPFVAVRGMGDQGGMSPGEARRAATGEEAVYPEAMTELLMLVPDGAAVASDGRNLYVALPGRNRESL